MNKLLSSCLLILFLSNFCSSLKVCNVLDYDAKADNATDVGPAILKAYSQCASLNPSSVLLVPAGLFLLNSNVWLKGSYYTLQIDGTITIAFNTKLGGTMLSWSDCDHVTLTGSGKIVGQGTYWRPDGDLTLYPSRPRMIRFQNCNYCTISGLYLDNSPKFHVTVIGDNNRITNVVVKADVIGETDAFDVSGNNNYVGNVEVTNGDECVTVKNPTTNFIAENIICHYSGGCSMGSFGNGANSVNISHVHYRNVTMYNTNRGAQIKTYPNNLGTVSNVVYQDFTLSNVLYPLDIDLYWCPHTTCPAATGTLVIKDVTFVNIKGTQYVEQKRPAVQVICIPGHTCTNINFSNVQITASNGNAMHDYFSNACGGGRPTLPACPSGSK